MSNQITIPQKELCSNITNTIISRKDQIVSLLGKSGIDFNYFKLILTSTFFNKIKDEQLQNLNTNSFLYAIYSCAQHKLLPDNREATFTLYKNKNGQYDVTYIPMYAGLLRTVMQTGFFETFEARVVYEKDDFEIDYMSESPIKHKMFINKNGESKGNIIHAYAFLRLKNSNRIIFDVYDNEVIQKIKNSSQAYRNDKDKISPWNKWEAEMWKKSVGKKVLKQSLCYIPFNKDLKNISTDNPVMDIEDNELDDEVIIEGQSNKLAALADLEQENELFPPQDGTSQTEEAQANA